jgi:hypothetical protein
LAQGERYGSTHFGAEQVTDDDRAYIGSRFAEVRDALFANPYQKVWGGAGEPSLPTYEVTLLGVLRGVLPPGQPYFFRQAVARAVDARSDLRWGTDRKGFRRIIHPNGICLTGLWEISEDTIYSGYSKSTVERWWSGATPPAVRRHVVARSGRYHW